MEHGAGLDQIIHQISLSMGTAWASGLNLYATICILGIMGATGNMVLPPELQVLAAPGVIIAAGVMYIVEFVADKIPAFDTAWDSIHTFIRIPAGAILAAQAMGEVGPEAMVIAGILGGGLAAGTHAAKAGARVLINTSPEPVTNWVASITEDIVVIGGLYAALNFPWVFLAALLVFILLLIWLLPRLWRGICAVFRTLKRWITGSGEVHREAVAASGVTPMDTPSWAMRARRDPSLASSLSPTQAETAPSAGTQDIRRKLDELEALYGEGRLKDDEYQAMRAKLLESLL